MGGSAFEGWTASTCAIGTWRLQSSSDVKLQDTSSIDVPLDTLHDAPLDVPPDALPDSPLDAPLGTLLDALLACRLLLSVREPIGIA